MGAAGGDFNFISKWRTVSCETSSTTSNSTNLSAGRRTCPGCKAVYHVTARPLRVKGVCDRCGARLSQREDDRPESVQVRMAAYEASTHPLAE
jgi:adenylate kinase